MSFMALGLFWGAFAASVPDVKRAAGLSDAGLGLALLVSTLGAVAAMWLAPRIEARLGARALGVITGIAAFGALLPGLAGSPLAFTAAMVAACAGYGLLDVAMNARVSALEAESGRSLMNLNHAAYSLIYAVAAVAAGLARQWGAAPLAIFTAVALLSGLAAFYVLRVPAPAGAASEGPDASQQGPEGPALSLPIILSGGAIICLAFLAEQGTEGWSALHLERSHDAGAAAGAIGPALLGLTMGIGRLFGQVATRYVRESVLIRAAALVAASGAALAAHAPQLGLAYAGFTIMGLGLSLIVPTVFAWAGKRIRARDRALMVSRLSVVGYAGFFAGPPMMGLLAEGFGLAASFTALAVLILAIPVVLLPLMRRAAPDPIRR
ncbi:Inner membrane protein YbjJ [Roseivivax sp. THAF40]|uniref:MFS transporter n=2 Tax=unclassified Roseivivax TaxID=2639302 RepID=UPI0012A99023|nr:MFS transporter [Roseivivax sp. THAF197b]QFS83789.1 Inner membrane protein YbjJ [Roseivivax sp. THAF197b]QFT47621.1 Inner membrane protein YbjJ [Roseivivax sp. THAF40]